MIDQSLLNRDLDPSDSDSVSTESSLNHYVIRITPCDKFLTENLHQFLAEEPQLTNYLLAVETVPHLHYHIVVSTDSSVSQQDVRDIIRAFITPFWINPNTGKCPRGFGNKQFSILLPTNPPDCPDDPIPDHAVSYALKETKEFYYEGFTEEYIEQCKAKSFPKKKVANFKVEYQQLVTKFHLSTMDMREFMTCYISLKAKYGQSIRTLDAYGYALSNLFLREPNLIENHVEAFLYKV